MEKDILNNSGLSKNESEIYLILLKLGEGTIYEIANHCKISRPNIYDIIKTLSEKGLVTFLIKNKKKFFKPVSPEKLIEILKEKELNLLSVMPKLNSLYDNKFKKPLIEIFEGIEGLKKIMNEMSNAKKENLIFNAVSEDYLKNKIHDFDIDKYLVAKKNKKIITKVLYSGKIKLVKGAGYKFKKLPNENLGCVGYWVYDDKVGIGIWAEPLLIIRIIDEDVAKTFRTNLNLIWNSIK